MAPLLPPVPPPEKLLPLPDMEATSNALLNASNFDLAVSEYEASERLGLHSITLAGALIWLGLYDEETLAKYEAKPEFNTSVRRLRAFIMREYERQLSKSASAGAIFALKNMGWTDKKDLTVSDPDGKPLTLRVEFVNPGGKGAE